MRTSTSTPRLTTVPSPHPSISLRAPTYPPAPAGSQPLHASLASLASLTSLASPRIPAAPPIMIFCHVVQIAPFRPIYSHN